MKKILIALAFMAIGFGTTHAQSIVKLDPISLAFGSLRAGYETFNDKNSIYVGASFINRKILGVGYTGAGVFGQYRWYLSDTETPKGVFAGPHAGFNFVSFDDGFDSRTGYSVLRLGGMVGYQGVIGSNFTWEIGIGPSYGIVFSSEELFDDVFGNGILPISTFAIGYRLD